MPLSRPQSSPATGDSRRGAPGGPGCGHAERTADASIQPVIGRSGVSPGAHHHAVAGPPLQVAQRLRWEEGQTLTEICVKGPLGAGFGFSTLKPHSPNACRLT